MAIRNSLIDEVPAISSNFSDVWVGFDNSTGYSEQNGPFQVSDDIYLLFAEGQFGNSYRGGNQRLTVFKMFDQGTGDGTNADWRMMDYSGADVTENVNAMRFYACAGHMDGTTMHCISVIRTTDWTLGPGYLYHTFDTATDTWSITGEAMSTALDFFDDFCQLDMRSDGDVMVHYSHTDKIMGTDYSRASLARRESSTWTIEIELSNQSPALEENFTGALIQHDNDTNDRMYLFYFDEGELPRLTTYNSNNTFGTNQRYLESDGYFNTPLKQVVAYDDGGTTQFRVLLRSSSSTEDNKPHIIDFQEGTGPTINTPTSLEDVSISIVDEWAFGIDSKVLYLFYNGFPGGANLINSDSNQVWPEHDAKAEADYMPVEGNFNTYPTVLRFRGTVYLRNDELVLAFYNSVRLTISPWGAAILYREISLERSLVLNPLPMKHLVVR